MSPLRVVWLSYCLVKFGRGLSYGGIEMEVVIFLIGWLLFGTLWDKLTRAYHERQVDRELRERTTRFA